MSLSTHLSSIGPAIFVHGPCCEYQEGFTATTDATNHKYSAVISLKHLSSTILRCWLRYWRFPAKDVTLLIELDQIQRLHMYHKPHSDPGRRVSKSKPEEKRPFWLKIQPMARLRTLWSLQRSFISNSDQVSKGNHEQKKEAYMIEVEITMNKSYCYARCKRCCLSHSFDSSLLSIRSKWCLVSILRHRYECNWAVGAATMVDA
jgi:hypothetical protein